MATICVGIAMSMGALLLAAGTAEAHALPNSKILIHQVSGGFQGQGTDIEIQARETISLKRRLEEIIAEHTNQPMEKVSKDMEHDYFMTAARREEYGIVDQVIAHRRLDESVGPGKRRQMARASDGKSSSSAASAGRASVRSKS